MKLEMLLFLSDLEREFFSRLEEGMVYNEIKEIWIESKTATLEALTND